MVCEDCDYEMNVAFGIVGTTQIAGHPTRCSNCNSLRIKNLSDGWNADNKNEVKKLQQNFIDHNLWIPLKLAKKYSGISKKEIRKKAIKGIIRTRKLWDDYNATGYNKEDIKNYYGL